MLIVYLALQSKSADYLYGFSNHSGSLFKAHQQGPKCKQNIVLDIVRHLLAHICIRLNYCFFSLLGSLSSSHASSKGSLSSLSFTDIYGLSTTASATANSAADLQKKFLQQPRGHSVGVSAGEPRNENHRNVLDLSSSQQSLSPHR